MTNYQPKKIRFIFAGIETSNISGLKCNFKIYRHFIEISMVRQISEPSSFNKFFFGLSIERTFGCFSMPILQFQ